MCESKAVEFVCLRACFCVRTRVSVRMLVIVCVFARVIIPARKKLFVVIIKTKLFGAQREHSSCREG